MFLKNIKLYLFVSVTIVTKSPVIDSKCTYKSTSHINLTSGQLYRQY